MKLVSGTGRITLDNTMEERLRLLEDKVLHLTFPFFVDTLTNGSLFIRCYQRSGKSYLGPTKTVNSSHEYSA